jgi:hypothetical protein
MIKLGYRGCSPNPPSLPCNNIRQVSVLDCRFPDGRELK